MFKKFPKQMNKVNWQRKYKKKILKNYLQLIKNLNNKYQKASKKKVKQRIKLTKYKKMMKMNKTWFKQQYHKKIKQFKIKRSSKIVKKLIFKIPKQFLKTRI